MKFCKNCGEKLEIPESYSFGTEIVCYNCDCSNLERPLISVAVLATTPSNKVLVGTRKKPPKIGQCSLLGGIVANESLQEKAASELNEESSGLVEVNPSDVKIIRYAQVENNRVLLFLAKVIIPEINLKKFKPNREMASLGLLDKPETLAFEEHTKLVREHFQSLRSPRSEK